jgi:hypothetical protein
VPSLVLPSLASASAAFAVAGETSRILVLRSYHPTYAWTRQLDEGLTAGLSAAETSNRVEAFTYDMDTKGHHDPVYLDQVVKALAIHNRRASATCT